MDIKKQIDKVLSEKVEKMFLSGVRDIARNTFNTLTIEAAKPNSPLGSPVYSGRFRGSHRVALNQPDTTSLPPTPKAFMRNVYPAPRKAQLESSLKNLKMGDTVIFSNSVGYAQKIESGLASRKTPKGVYGVTAEYIKAYYKTFKPEISDK